MEILKNRMIRDYNLKVHVGRPRVSYRETIKKAVKKVQGSFDSVSNRGNGNVVSCPAARRRWSRRCASAA